MTEQLAALSQELRLLTTLTGFYPPTEQQVKPLLFNIEDSPGWERFIHTAERHGLPGLAYKRLLELENLSLPTELPATLTGRHRTAVVQSLVNKAATIEVSQLLSENGIRHLVLKGPAMTEPIYGGTGLRLSEDVDLLVQKEDVEDALKAMYGGGYLDTNGQKPDISNLTRRIHQEFQLIAPKGQSMVELHWRLFENPRYLDAYTSNKFTAEETTLMDDQILPVMPNEYVPLYMMCHGASHHFSILKYMCDLHWLFSREPSLLEQTQRQTKAMQLEGTFALSIEMLAALYGHTLPRDTDQITKGAMPFLLEDALDALNLKDLLTPARESRNLHRLYRAWRFRSNLSEGLHYKIFELAKPVWLSFT